MNTNDRSLEMLHNLNGQVWDVRIDDADNPGSRVSLGELAERIHQMDLSPEFRTAHTAGLAAAQLTLSYLDHNAAPINEKALEVGMLATLGLYIVGETPISNKAIDTAKIYQEQILFSRVLDDPLVQGVYAVPNSRKHDSVMSRMQMGIRLNPFHYLDGRIVFSEYYGEIVQEFKTTIRTTPPTNEAITYHRGDSQSSNVLDRFLQLRQSLQNYVPRLLEMEEELWRYARNYYAQNYHRNKSKDQ